MSSPPRPPGRADAEIERWKKYLRRDPTRWLLETGDPSILLWYQIDIAHRPEESVAVTQAREAVLYSPPVQGLFATQDELGYWGDPASLALPYYDATLWNLALLAELGLGRSSRRARAACEYALEHAAGTSGRAGELSPVETGYLLHALGYFNLAEDARVRRIARELVAQAARPDAGEDERVAALWGVQEIQLDEAGDNARREMRRRARASLERRADFGPLTWPPFDPSDPLFILRALTGGKSDDAWENEAGVRALVERVVARQDDEARWPLEQGLDNRHARPLEAAGAESRWVTLNALRVIVRLINQDK
jgi:hypothetical protein